LLCFALLCFALICFALHCITWHCFALHCFALHCFALDFARSAFFFFCDVFDILDFFDIFDFSLWGEEPGSGGPRNPGGAHPQGTRGADRPAQLTGYFGTQ
jgi:hypothetical protein